MLTPGRAHGLHRNWFEHGEGGAGNEGRGKRSLSVRSARGSTTSSQLIQKVERGGLESYRKVGTLKQRRQIHKPQSPDFHNPNHRMSPYRIYPPHVSGHSNVAEHQANLPNRPSATALPGFDPFTI